MCLLANAIHFCLLLCKCRELALECLDLRLQLCRPGCSLVDSGGHFCNILLQLTFFGCGFSQLLITIRLLCGLVTSLFFELGNHILDEAFRLCEWAAAGRAEAQNCR